MYLYRELEEVQDSFPLPLILNFALFRLLPWSQLYVSTEGDDSGPHIISQRRLNLTIFRTMLFLTWRSLRRRLCFLIILLRYIVKILLRRDLLRRERNCSIYTALFLYLWYMSLYCHLFNNFFLFLDAIKREDILVARVVHLSDVEAL